MPRWPQAPHINSAAAATKAANGSASNARKLRRKDGAWSRDHGTWYYQLELPSHPGGTRRAPLRRGGFTNQTAAQHELERARELLAIADPRDTGTRIRIADAICRALKTTKELPDPAAIRKMARTGRDSPRRAPSAKGSTNGSRPRNCVTTPSAATKAHVRLHYQPHIGHVRIDRLRVSDVASVFEAIDELNDTITEARSSGDPALRATVKGRRTVGAATKHRHPRHTALGHHHLPQAKSRPARRQRRRPRGPAIGQAAQAAGLDRRTGPRLAERLPGPASRRAHAGGRQTGRRARGLHRHPTALPRHGLDPGPDPRLPYPRAAPPPICALT